MTSEINEINVQEILKQYQIINTIKEDDNLIKYIIKKIDTEILCVMTITTKGNYKLFKQLKKCDYLNINKIIEVEKIPDGKIVIIEDYMEDAQTLRYHIENNMSINNFEDVLLQICDALIYLLSLKTPITYNNINIDNIIICDDNVVKIINFEKADFNANSKKDIKMFGELINNSGDKYAKKYRKIIKDCKDVYQTPSEIQKAINASRRILGVKYSLLVLIGIIMMVLLRFGWGFVRTGGILRNIMNNR